MAARRLFRGSRAYCPWKKGCRVVVTLMILGSTIFIAFFTFFLQPSKLLTTDSNAARIQAEILEKNPLKGMTNPEKAVNINITSVNNSSGRNEIPKDTSSTPVKPVNVDAAPVKRSPENSRSTKELSKVLQSHSLCPTEEVMKSSKVTKLGRYPQTKRYLSIGIASVARPSGANYLPQTIQSLIDSLGENDKKDTYIVIFLADLRDPPKSTAKAELSKSFGKYINEGLLTVIEAYPEYYPPLTNIKQKYGDSDSRRTWRSKENVDATFVMCYCNELSQYYIHLEDDVLSSPSFFPKLQDFINKQNVKPWTMLDATIMGSKAKVFQSKDVGNIASYFYLMYDEMPIDWLMGHWRQIKSQTANKDNDRLPAASLFNHIGDRSSLPENGLSGLKQKEPFFDQYDQKYKGLNPPATVTSSMSPQQGKPQDAYDKGSGYFWAQNPRKDDYVLIKFNRPTAVQEVFVETACYQAKSDLLKSGVLQASYETAASGLQSKDNNDCGHFETLGAFSGGKAKFSVDKSKKVICLRILVTQDQSEWIYFREIDVW